MKRSVFLLALLSGLPMLSMAQDDMYFTPSSADKAVAPTEKKEAPTYYSGINKSSDAYNRRGKFRSSYQIIGKDSLGNEIVEFESKDGIARRDTIYGGYIRQAEADDDFAYSRRMSRFDDYYGFYDPWFASSFYYGYPGFYAGWRWRSPFYYGGFYDPWYYGSFYAGYPYYYYGSPYYYGGFGFYNPWYYGGYYYPRYTAYYSYNGHAGTANHWGHRALGNNRSYSSTNSFGSRSFGTRQRSMQNYPVRRSQSYTDRFGGSRSTMTPTRSYSQPSSSFGGASRGSFGGGSFGGSRGSFGGGHFGGRR